MLKVTLTLFTGCAFKFDYFYLINNGKFCLAKITAFGALQSTGDLQRKFLRKYSFSCNAAFMANISRCLWTSLCVAGTFLIRH